MQIIQMHRSSKWQRKDLKQGSLASESVFLTFLRAVLLKLFV